MTALSEGQWQIATATAAKSGSTVTATVSGITVTIEVGRDLTVAANDVLLVAKAGPKWYVVQRLYAAAVLDPGNPDSPTPNPSTRTGSTPFAPVETRSYRNSTWRTDNDDVYQGSFGSGNHTGCAFYGNGPRSLAGATVTAARIAVRRKNGGGITAPQATTMRLVVERTRPAGAPTLGSSTSGPTLGWGQASTAFAIPTSWAQAMVDGTAGGLGFFDADGSPYVIFDGRSHYGPAFTLTISWTR